ncbi:MAG: DUF2079 domain-containing protein [Actinomycetota bacterium]|nr:DUF2079 domain-containing protein [Actinomycetota bacterium]
MTVTATEPARAAEATRAHRVIERLVAADPWWWALGVLVVAWTWYFTALTLDVHHGLGTSSYDFGLYDQGVWLLSRFDAPFVTLMGRNLFGDHTSFILVVLVPLYWVAPSAGALLFSQAALIGAGAIPIFAYAKRRLDSGALALVFAVMYLLHPAVGWTNLENFHPDAFLGFFVATTIFAALERRWRLYAVFVVLALLVKEDASLVIVPLGVWVALRRDRRIGLLTVAGSIGFMLVAMFVVMRALVGVPTRNTWRIPFGGIGGLTRTTLTRPSDVIEHLRSEGRGFYLWQMLTPFAWLAARVPSVALISGLVLFTNVLSTYAYQHLIQYHYSMIAVPALALGAAHGVGALSGRVRVVVVGMAAGTSLLTATLWGPLPFSRNELAVWAPSHPGAVAARHLADRVPDDAVVSVHHSIAPHLARREKIYQFPNPFRVVLYGPDISLEGTRLVDRADEIEYVLLPVARSEEEAVDLSRIREGFVLVEANEYWELFLRSGDLPQP